MIILKWCILALKICSNELYKIALQKSSDESLICFSVISRPMFRWLTSRVQASLFFEFLKKIKLTTLVCWVKRLIWVEFLINQFLIKKRVSLVVKRKFIGISRAAAISKMECFEIIVNDFQPLTIITRRSILDVAAVLDPPLN